MYFTECILHKYVNKGTVPGGGYGKGGKKHQGKRKKKGKGNFYKV